MTPLQASRLVFASELVRLVRDRRAFFAAVVLPMLLYPVLFLGMDAMDDAARRSVEEKPVRIAHDLAALPGELARRVIEAWRAPGLRAELVEAPSGLAEELAQGSAEERRERWEHISVDLLVQASAAPDAAAAPRLAFFVDRSDTLSRSAEERARDAMEGLGHTVSHERLLSVTGADPAASLDVRSEDVARPEDTSGRELGKLLPFLAVLLLVSAGSFAALDAFAGERESGTLETLLVQPVPARAIATGKFAAVLTTAVVALLGNALSFLACLAAGLGEDTKGALDFTLGATGLRLVEGLLLVAPTAFLLAALLCLISARAKSFREGQHYVFPLLIFTIAPAALSTVERVELGWLLAVVPIAGPALAFRDALTGTLRPGPALLAFGTSSAWAWLALSRLAQTLDAERILATRGAAAEDAVRKTNARRALAWGWSAVGLVYLVGGRLQAWSLVPGLALTLCVLVPALAVAAARDTRRQNGGTLAARLGLRRPPWNAMLGALCLAPGAKLVAAWVLAHQERLLPLPPDLALPDLDFSAAGTFALLCLAPGLFEELLFRGAILERLRLDLRPGRVLLWQALLFGAVHASVYRFVPTALLGTLLAGIALRARSIWPGVLLHTAYNALVAFDVELGPLPAALATVVALGLLARRPARSD